MILCLKFKKVFFREKRTTCEELLCEMNYEKLSYEFFLPKSVLGPECTQQREKKKRHLLDTLPRMFRWQLRAAVRWPAYSREGGQCPSPTCSCLFVINMGQVNTRDVGAKTLSPLSSHHMAECPTHPEPDASPASCGT